MRYYIYVSATKVDQLYAQIPRSLRDRIAAKFTIDLKLIKGEFEGRQGQESLFSKLEVVRNYLESEELIGSVDDPRDFFAGTMPLSWGIYGYDKQRTSEFVYFGGQTQRTILGMGGSLHHVIGEVGQAHPHSYSATPRLTTALKVMTITERDTEPEEYEEKFLRNAHYEPWLGSPADQIPGVLHSVWLATTRTDGVLEPMEFIAKRLLRDYHKNANASVLLGTPLYVALAE
jgi:hypothetical protein